MQIIKPPCTVFQAECPNCHAVIEYDASEVAKGYVHCCSCFDWFSHIAYSNPVESSRYSDD